MSRTEYMKEYLKEYMREKRDVNNSVNKDDVNKDVNNIDWLPEPDVMVKGGYQGIKMFDGIGRGVPHKGLVLIAKRSEPNGNTEHGVVAEKAWKDRLDFTCSHNLKGWSCKECLSA